MLFALIAIGFRLGVALSASPSTLCASASTDFRSAACRSVDGLRFTPPANQYFTWRSENDRLIIVGSSRAHGLVAFEVTKPPTDANSSTLTIASDHGASWILPFSGNGLIALAAGRYRFILDVPGYRRVVRERVDVRQQAVVRLPSIELVARPLISGRVVDADDGEPIPGAAIAFDDQVPSARSDRDGRFDVHKPAETTTSMIIAAPGFAAHSIDLTSLRSDTVLPLVRLTRGAGVQIHVERDCRDDAACRTRVMLYVRNPNASPPDLWRAIGERSASGSRSTVTFDHIEPGRYVVLGAGELPLQRKVQDVVVRAGETSSVTMPLHDRTLKGSVTYGTEGTSCDIRLSAGQGVWSATIRSDSRGDFSGVIWDGGMWSAVMTPADEGDPFFAVHNIGESPEEIWDIAIPRREIVGRTVDRDTHEPVRGIAVEDAAFSDSGPRTYRSRPSDDDGRFRLPMLPRGRHSLSVEAQGYLDVPPIAVELGDGEMQRVVNIELACGQDVAIHVTNGEGKPVAGARVYDGVTNLGIDTRLPYRTDAFGSVTIPLKPGTQKPVYVLADDGSFATMLADSAVASMDVTLQPPLGALKLVATRASAPAGGVQFLVRVDGRFLPPAIWDLVSGSIHANSTATAADGSVSIAALPLGTYEFWPYRTIDELRSLFARVYSLKAATITLQPGANTLVVPLQETQ